MRRSLFVAQADMEPVVYPSVFPASGSLAVRLNPRSAGKERLWAAVLPTADPPTGQNVKRRFLTAAAEADSPAGRGRCRRSRQRGTGRVRLPRYRGESARRRARAPARKFCILYFAFCILSTRLCRVPVHPWTVHPPPQAAFSVPFMVFYHTPVGKARVILRFPLAFFAASGYNRVQTGTNV